MATLIKFKRSLETSIPVSLSNGEPAWTSNGDILYIGAYDGTITPIAGKRFPGVLTANQALVTNSTNMIDKIMYGNSTVNAIVNSIAFSLANATVSFSLIKPTATEISDGDKFLKADGTWSTVVGGSAEPGGSNTEVQFNDSDALGGSAGFTFNKTTNNLSIANTLLVGANVSLNTVKLDIGNTTVNTVVNSIAIVLNGVSINTTAFLAGANVFLDQVKLSMGNTTVNSIANSVIHRIENASASANLKATGLEVGTTVVNATTVVIGGGTSANSTTINATDVNVSGNLVVSGTVTTLDATNLIVQDPLIRLADDQANTASYVDTADIGFYGTYGNTTQINFTGLFRDASDSGIYKLFAGEIPSPTTAVDTANVNFAFATLQSYLKSANLVVNSTGFTVGGNTTWAVAIAANTLTVSTAIGGPSGGTGLSTYAIEDILVANSTNGFRKLAFAANKVLQTNGSAVLYDDLDGGTF